MLDRVPKVFWEEVKDIRRDIDFVGEGVRRRAEERVLLLEMVLYVA